MASPGLKNTRFITTPDNPSRVYKIRRLSDGAFKQLFSVTECNTDADRWGHRNDRLWITQDEAYKQLRREKQPCEVVHYALVEVTS